MNQESYEQIERYLAGEMPVAERYAFEKLVKQDARLAEEIRQHTVLLNSMNLLASRTKLKKQMDVFHGELEEEGITRNMQVSRYGLRLVWKKYLPTIAVAASVAMITVMSTLLMLNNLRSIDNRQTNQYLKLKEDYADLRKKVEKVSSTVSQNQSVTEARPARYGGTGFMISPNGYIITSKHLIEDADSIYVESVTDGPYRYKVKLVYQDPNSRVDLALLKITDENFQPLKRLPFALRTEEADLAEPVYTLGYPGDNLVYNDGTVSSHTGFDGDTAAYRISIPVNFGNSGGPLLDERGNLLGIIAGKNAASEGTSFAIKSKHILRMIDSVPADSLSDPLSLSWKNYVKDLKRPEQIKKLQNFVFNVKVF